MKNFTLLLIAILSVTMAYAQTTPSTVPGNLLLTPQMTFKNSLPQHLSVPDAAKNKISPRVGSGAYKLGNSEYDSIYDWEQIKPSDTWKYIYKYVDLTYDANNNLTNYVEQLWDTTHWENDLRYSYSYNSAHQVTYELEQQWGDTSWVNYFELINTYNGANKEITSIDESWNDSAWLNVQKDTFAYNAYDSIANEILETWVDTVWGGFYQQVRTYNSSNLLDTILVQGANDNFQWTNSLLFTYTYKPDSSFEIDGSWKSGAWANTYKYIDSYNAGGFMTSQLTQTPSGLSWDNYSLYLLTYNADNLNTVFLVQTVQGNSWQNIEQYLYGYNAANLDTSYIFQVYSASWKNSFVTTTAYNSNNIEVTSENFYYNTNSPGDTLTSEDSLHFYPAGPAGINQLRMDGGQLSVYPNPSSNFIHTDIQLKQNENLQLRLVNILGQTVWSVDAGNVSAYQNNISVSNLPDGVYLLEMVTGGGMETRQVVVAR